MAKHDTTPWPAHEEALLVKLKEEGKSHQQCADILNRTRNMIVGKWDRMQVRDKLRKRKKRIREKKTLPVPVEKYTKRHRSWTEERLTEPWADRKARLAAERNQP